MTIGKIGSNYGVTQSVVDRIEYMKSIAYSIRDSTTNMVNYKPAKSGFLEQQRMTISGLGGLVDKLG